MNTNMNERDLVERLQCMHEEMIAFCMENLPLACSVQPAEVSLRALLVDGCLCYHQSEKRYLIYISNLRTWGDLHAIAQAERAVCHETAHLLHAAINPTYWDLCMSERNFMEREFKKGRTILYDRLLDQGEACAEFVALWYLDQQYGFETFYSRLKKPTTPDPNSLYQRVSSLYQTIVGSALTKRCALDLLTQPYPALRAHPQLATLFDCTETYIVTHREEYVSVSQPYQLTLL